MTSGPMSMDKPEWKKRFSASQLERKRLVDRVNRRKTRGESRQAITEMEERLRLLSNGRDGELIQRLMDQNTTLRASSARYHAKFEELVQLGRLFLDQEENSKEPAEGQIGPIDKNSQNNDSHSVGSDTPKAPPNAVTSELSISTSPPYAAGKDSIFFEVAMYMQSQSSTATGRILTDDFIEAFMAWKCSKGYNVSPCALLIDYSNKGCPIRSCSSACKMDIDEMENQMGSETLFHDILDSLLHDRPLPASSEKRSPGGQMQSPIDEIRRQRRGAAFSAYHTVSHWRHLFPSVLEVILVFWTQYRANLFFTFPTAKNLHQLPKWRRPVISQFIHPHPGFIDSLVWPRLRDHLVRSWNKYNTQHLLLTLTSHFKLKAPSIFPADIISVNAEATDFIIDRTFRTAIQTVDNLTTCQDFSLVYPDLYPLISLEPVCSLDGTLQDSFMDYNIEDNDGGGQGVNFLAQGENEMDREIAAFLQELNGNTSDQVVNTDVCQPFNSGSDGVLMGENRCDEMQALVSILGPEFVTGLGSPYEDHTCGGFTSRSL